MVKNWIEVFRETVKKNKSKVAVIHRENEITFSELNEKALQIAGIIKSKTAQSNRPIVVLLPKSIEAVYADIGIMYSCNIFSNLDVKTPSERLNNIVAAMHPIGIITTREEENLLDIPSDMFAIYADDLENSAYSEKLILADIDRQIDTDPFCIINTSGSTGTPKGVVLNHKSFFDFMEWAFATFDLEGNDRIGSLSPIVFDIYDFELCFMMSKGATIVLLDASNAAFPARLLQVLQKQKITFLFWVPTIMVNIANMDLLSKIQLDSIRTIWFAGEVFPTKQFNYWRGKLTGTTFANLYGPIEITLDCIYYVADKMIAEDEPLPIGIPCRNTDILLLNDQNEICQDDEEGEICVRGTSLAMGYYNNPEKTKAAFVQNPLNSSYPEIIYRTGDIGVRKSEDSLIYFRGRKDSLIKHMGYRIELGEIEHILVNELKVVKNCCVVYDFSKKQIVLYYEPLRFDKRQIQQKLMKVFPRYMIPTIWNQVEELPRNTNGKIDRLLLSQRVNEQEAE